MTTTDRRTGAALDLLAACNPLPIAVAERLVDPEVLDALERDGVVEVSPRSHGSAGLVSVREPSALPALGTVRRRTLARTVADAIEPQDAHEVTPDVATVLGDALSEADRYVEHVVTRAVRASLVRGDIDRAVELASFGLRHDPGHTELRHLLAMAHEAVGRHGAAAVLGVDDEHDAAWLGRWSSNRFLSTGVAPSLRDASAVDDRHNELLANETWIHAIDGDVDATAAAVGKVLDDPRSSAQAVVWVCVAGAVPAALDGRRVVAHRLIDQARAIHAHDPSALTPFAEFQIELAAFLAEVRLGEFAGLQDLVDRQTAPEVPELVAATWACFGGNLDRETGRFESGIARFERGLATFEHDPFGFVTWARSELETCRAMARPGEGAAGLALADSGEGFGLYTSCLQRNAAWIDAARGDVAGAVRRTERAIEIAAGRRQNAHMLLGLVDLARFGQPRRAAGMLADLTDVESDLIRTGATAVLALASDQPGELADAATAARRLHLEPLASELSLRALERAARTVSAAARAKLEIVLDVAHAATPILRSQAAVEPVLTAREREVARLAATSLSSRAIGEQLEVTTRTVDNLLGRVYAKADLSGRAELAALTLTG